jgi:hypothetical protein
VARVSSNDQELVVRLPEAKGAYPSLASTCALVIERHFDPAACAAWVDGVYRARHDWTHDFGGEQFTLGRAFYTHFEEGRSKDYFKDTAASDALVERHAPGLQRAMHDLAQSVLQTRIVQRRGWCGPGVHVFPPDGPVAERGGVRHFDTEGLAARHVALRRPAITLVAMLQTPKSAGGLEVWAVRYDGHDHPTEAELARPSAIVTSQVGDVVIIDSYRLHQIQPFDSDGRERISATVHAAEVDAGLWECWF